MPPTSNDALTPVVLPTETYASLRALARRHLAGERGNHTLQPTALAHEAFLRVSGAKASQPENSAAFLLAAAQAMRSILVDHARRRAALKRGGNSRREAIEPDALPALEVNVDLVALDEALDRLRNLDPELAQVVELRYFGGLGDAEIGVALKCSTRSIRRAWSVARAWLARELDR